MIKINIIAVGRLKESYWDDAYSDYAKQISRYAKLSLFEVVEQSKILDINAQLLAESQHILNKLSGYTILTDRTGIIIDDAGFAKIITSNALNGISEFTYIVGGSRGCHPNVHAKANKIISFGKITLPHRLARIVLAEQIYRALSVINGSPYHK
ncbi:MAG: 23S rRNA (pseudouridine(1915)-N(3))-methyltransferase RlmH [Christensenellaceae bacterium]|nr:23S rRNA (pseudouridine(1915)-N(3))-methyltransferase RlmH [Christensenellaceae bacterium]